MSEAPLPREPQEQVVDIDIRHLLLGCIAAGATVAVLSLVVSISRGRARMRRQEALLQGAERLLLLIQQIRETPTPEK